MTSLVAPDVATKLSQILSNLVLGENEVRRAAEKTLNDEWLAKDPGTVLTALAQFTRTSPDVHMRSFAAVLLRRLTFRPVPHASMVSQSSTIYDNIRTSTLKMIEGLLLDCIANETDVGARNKIIDTTCEWADKSYDRHQPWPELQAFTAQYTMSPDPVHREIAFRLLANVPRLILDSPVNDIVAVLQRGLSAETTTVQLAALKASTAFLTSTDKQTRQRAADIMTTMLNTLPPLQPAAQGPFLQALIPLATSEPGLFRPHLESLITFLPPLIHLGHNANAPTPTSAVSNGNLHSQNGFDEESEAMAETRYGALELLVTLTELIPKAVQGCPQWIPNLVQCCLEGMSEINDDVNGDWLERSPDEEDDAEGYPREFEHAIDRCARALGSPILPVTFQYVPAMLAAPDWQHRHAGLMAICAVGEGTAQWMENDLGSVVSLILPLFHDPHPRLRHGACHCVGVLCDDVGEMIQAEYTPQLLPALVETLQAPEPRVQAHAAAAIVNFCSGATKEIISPYLDGIVKGILNVLNSSTQAYVQQQILTTLAMVADASQSLFKKYYPVIFPMLLSVLESAADKKQRVLRCRAMECASIVGMACGKNTFKKDAGTLTALLLRIQTTLGDDDDATPSYLLTTWTRVAQVMKGDFVPYLPLVMPLLLHAAALKPDFSLINEDEEPVMEDNSWQTLRVGGQRIGIKTAIVEETIEAFDNLSRICIALGENFVEYVRPVLELALPGLRNLYSDIIRENCATLIPLLIRCGKSILTESDLQTIFRSLLSVINDEADPGFLTTLFKNLADSILLVHPNSLPGDLKADIILATQNKLHSLAQRRKQRQEFLATQSPEELADESEDVKLIEELEDFALDEIARLIALFDSNHRLLVGVSSVRELGVFGPASYDV